MIDAYRTPADRCPPACHRCMAGWWMAYDVMWDEFVCMACRAIIDPYWRVDEEEKAKALLELLEAKVDVEALVASIDRSMATKR